MSAVVTEPASVPAGIIGLPLRVEAVTKRFGGVLAVDDVSLSVAPGEALAIIGPNGAGKSTLLKAISGVQRPTSGRIFVGETRVDRLATHRVTRAGVAIASQVPRPFRALTVRENVRVGLMHSRGEATDVDGVLERCQLAHRAEEPAGRLSVLDLKRLELARALSTNPQLVLFDEVAAGLVGRELRAVIDLIRSIHADGRTMLLVEHVEQVIASVVDRVIVLNWGSILAEGTPEQIAANPEVRSVYLGTGATETRRAAPVAPSERSGLLDVRGLTAGYGPLIAIRDIDLSIGEGELVAVLGANGAGKTTLAATISGLLRAREGTISFAGRDLTRVGAHQRARLGIAHSPEGRRVFADLTVEQNLMLAAPLRMPKKEVRERLARAHDVFPQLVDLAGRQAGTLSGGQQQMLAVGRALMASPRLIICDEISLGLAPVAIDSLYEAIVKVQEQGTAVLLIEQNVRRSLAVADRAYVLERGRISYDGDPEALLDESRLEQAYFGTHA
jgi:branched-chain amino acid transport system ATP-binding protein